MNWRSLMFLAVGTVLCARPVFAQGGSPTDADKQRSHEFMKQGISFYDKGQWQKAYEAFLAAWQLRKHFTILANLAYAEIEIGKLPEAAAHMQEYFTLAPQDRTRDRELVTARLAEVRAEIVTLTVDVNVDGADVSVNGNVAGTSPVGHDLFAMPGEITVEARHSGYDSAKQTLTGTKGATLNARLTLTKVAAEVPPPAVSANAAGSVVLPSKPPMLDAPPPVTKREEASTAPLFILGGAAALGIGSGIVFHFAAESNDSDYERLRKKMPDWACSSPSVASTTDCAAAADAQSAYRRNAVLSTTGFVVGGAGALGALAYYWFGMRETSPSYSTERAHARLNATAEPHGGAVWLSGKF